MNGNTKTFLLVLPVSFFAVSWVLRDNGGPFWIWHIVDPSYAYLVDALNLINLRWAQNIYHPGTTVTALAALIIKAAHPLSGGGDIAKIVLAEPERHLRLISTVFIAMNTAALGLVGFVGYRVFRNPILALTLQTAPFLSMVILKNSYHVKPEALLVFTMLILFALIIKALRPGEMEKHGTRYAIAFGAVAGFGVATKIVAGPVFILPLFLLGSPRRVAVYAVAALAFFILFFLPGLGSLGNFIDWLSKLAMGSGAYGTGPQTVIDASRYPGAVLKIFSRPILSITFLIGLGALVAAARRRDTRRPEVRALAGYCLAVLVHVLLVAKQPTALYMVPSYMAAALGIVLIQRVVSGLDLGGGRLRARANLGFAVLIGGLVAAQAFSVVGLDRELTGKRLVAEQVRNETFRKCARIYFFAPSSRRYALAHGDWWSGGNFAAILASQQPANIFWYQQDTKDFRDWKGSRDIREVIANASCVMARGTQTADIIGYLKEKVPDFSYSTSCSTRDETILTSGVDCSGR